MSRKHVIITGTGRAGTSFLVELMTHLGLETGYRAEDVSNHKSKTARAGLEYDIRKEDAPYIVKNPWFCEYATEVLEREDIQIEHAFIPMRDLHAAAESRRYVTNQTVAMMPLMKRIRHYWRPKALPGGECPKSSASNQEALLLENLYSLILTLSSSTIPVTLLRYPLLVNDSLYLYDKLLPILNGIGFEQFDATFNRVVDPSLIHSFNANDRCPGPAKAA